MTTTQIRHRGHNPRALVDVGTDVVKEPGRLGRGIASKIRETTESIGVVREPDHSPPPPYMLEFDGTDEISAVDGMNLGFPLQPRMNIGPLGILLWFYRRLDYCSLRVDRVSLEALGIRVCW